MVVWLNPRNWFRWLGDFIRSWLFTIPSSSIGPAVPSIICAAVVLSLVALTTIRGPAWRTERLRGNMQTALVTNNQAEVELICRRLLEHDPNDKALQFQLAAAMAKGDDRPSAIARMKQLALENDYPLAARWLLSEEFKDFKWAGADSEQREFLGSLLQTAVESGMADERITSSYVDYLLATGNLARALPYLESLAEKHPVRAMQAAAIYRKSRDNTRAETVAQQGLVKLEQLTAEEPGNAGHYLAQTRLLVFLERYEDALRLLKRGLDITQDDHLRQAAAETFVLWSKSLPADDGSSSHFAKRLLMLQKALALAPQNGHVLEALVPLVIETAEENSPNVAKLRRSLVSGVAPELSHFIRGTTAMLNGDAEQAATHLEIATKHMPNAPVVMNNLAVALASHENPDLEQSLALIDAALVQRPDEPYMHETRGQILLKMGRHHDAIVALEKALPATALAESIHRSLATAYREIGQLDLAEEHEQIVASKSR